LHKDMIDMSSASFIGNKLAVSILKKALETKRVASAYLFCGPDGVGKSLAALNFAKALLCEKRTNDSCDHCSSCRRVDSGNHPDVHWYKPTGKSRLVKIDQIRKELIPQANLKPFEAEWKVFIIVEADRMNDEAQNAVLKTLEEPPGQSVLILVTSNPSALLPTIVSRCQAIPFLPIPKDELEAAIAEKWGLAKEEAHLVASLACGSMGATKRLLERENLSRRKVLLTLLADAPQRTFKEIRDAIHAVEEELRQLSTGRRQREDKRIKAFAKALTTEQREDLIEETDAATASIIREEQEDILNLLASWYRDLLLIKENACSDLVTNSDMMEQLRNSAARMTRNQILMGLNAVEEARRALALNLPLGFSLQVLFLSAQREMAQT